VSTRANHIGEILLGGYLPHQADVVTVDSIGVSHQISDRGTSALAALFRLSKPNQRRVSVGHKYA
jgi:hypothetical protein